MRLLCVCACAVVVLFGISAQFCFLESGSSVRATLDLHQAECATLEPTQRMCVVHPDVNCPATACTGLQEGENVVFYCLDQNNKKVTHKEVFHASAPKNWSKNYPKGLYEVATANPVTCVTKNPCNCIEVNMVITCTTGEDEYEDGFLEINVEPWLCDTV